MSEYTCESVKGTGQGAMKIDKASDGDQGVVVIVVVVIYNTQTLTRT